MTPKIMECSLDGIPQARGGDCAAYYLIEGKDDTGNLLPAQHRCG